MPNIDTTKIENFESMTAEQKLDAILKLEIPEDVDMTKFVSKDTFDKKASEAASLSKQLRDRMTEDENKKADDEKALNDLKTELESLRKDKTIQEYKANYISQGMDAALAEDTAKALADGDMAKVFKNQTAFQETLKKKIREELVNKTPPPAGSGAGSEEKDAAVEYAKKLAQSRHGGDKQYEEIMSKYKK